MAKVKSSTTREQAKVEEKIPDPFAEMMKSAITAFLRDVLPGMMEHHHDLAERTTVAFERMAGASERIALAFEQAAAALKAIDEPTAAVSPAASGNGAANAA